MKNRQEEKADVFIHLRPTVVVRPDFSARLRTALLSYQVKQRSRTVIFNFFSMWRAWMAAMGVAVVVLVVLVVNFLTPVRTLGAELVYAEGEVFYRMAGGGWQEVGVGTTLNEGDGVKVVGDGRAIIILDDGSSVRLNSGSEATLASLVPEHMQIVNEQGEVYTRVVKSKRLFDVAVGETVYRSLGTAYTTVNTEETQGVEVYQSAVQVIASDETGNAEETIVPQGTAYYEVNVEEPAKEGEVTPIQADEIAQDEFVAWNAEQDGADETFKRELGVLTTIATVDDDSSSTNESGGEIVVAENTELTEAEAVNVAAYDEKVAEIKQLSKEVVSPTPGVSSVSEITLIPDSPESGHVSWTVEGNLVLGMDRGVRVLFSKSPNPTYGGTTLALPVGWKNYAKIWPKEGDGVYYVRVCEFLGDTCGRYSNEVTVTVRGSGSANEYFDKTVGEWKSDRTTNGPGQSTVTGITLTANDPAPEHVSWTIVGSMVQGMDRGVRVLFSKNPNPTLGQARALPVGYKRYTKIWPKDGAGTYYVRVCEYLGQNTCGTYSNEVTITVGESGTTGGEYKGSRVMDYRY